MSLARSVAESSCDGVRFRALMTDAATLLGRRSRLLDSLNVFPVPDGDTGANLTLTMRAAIEAMAHAADADLSAVAAALAHGALMGAHGNSGVILSQYLGGLARGLAGQRVADAPTFARALAEAAQQARGAVEQPVEGTILTVAHDAALAAAAAARAGAGLDRVLAAAAEEAQRSVERTRGLLPVLEQAQVVDAGALGLATLLEGLSRSWSGAPLPAEELAPVVRSAALDVEPGAYGFCTEFVIQGEGLDPLDLRGRLAALGDSVLAVGDARTVRVHLHTFRPEEAIRLGESLGRVDQVKVEDMQEQNRRLRQAEPDRFCGSCGLVAVVEGAGLAALFESLGATVIDARRSEDERLAQLTRLLGADRPRAHLALIFQPSLARRLREAAAAPDGTSCPVTVVELANPALGVAAALAFRPDRSLDQNLQAMARAVAGVRTARLAPAPSPDRAMVDGSAGPIDGTIRSAPLPPRLAVGPGAATVLGWVDGQVVVAGDDLPTVAVATLAHLGAADSEVITLYRGRDLSTEQAVAVRARVVASFPHCQVDLVDGGQSDGYLYLACE